MIAMVNHGMTSIEIFTPETVARTVMLEVTLKTKGYSLLSIVLVKMLWRYKMVFYLVYG
jgi:hypothetical protein